ncbi:hypothetical protein G8C92_16485 [Paenibacillus donghaensis]|uniref:hypothetical protein n=1 Tax=Paenibacillus donghaensis TaxID=414771 RepID=UPI0018835DB2|nr:hypothetical protein [Paenibacillus donghaensis]MBE9915617.1 hypothetical protein [Paenibacillus donghaensis]
MILVPDNLKTGVKTSSWYSPAINKTYQRPSITDSAPISGDVHLLYQALSEMADEDPFIRISWDAQGRRFTSGCSASPEGSHSSCLAEEMRYCGRIFKDERHLRREAEGCGAECEVIFEDGNLFYGTVGFRVEPGAENSGIVYGLGVELGFLSLSFRNVIEESVFER